MNEINFFAKTNFRNKEAVFGIKEDDRRRHMYVIGKTGMGKSNLLENMAIQDISNGKGVCVVDPHGEFAEKMLRAIPGNRVNDVVYFNPADSEFPLAFNILESVDEDKKNLVASGMMGVFKKIWPDVWSPRMEYILNNTILALLDYPGSTMLGVNRMMSDADFRKRIYPKIKDPVVKSFWLNEFDKWEDKFRKEAVAAIQNKVGQFLSSYVIRHIIGQPKSTIDMREIMDNQKILIVNLSKGRIGEDSMRLSGGMIITKIQLAAMGRVEIPEEDRKDFYLYVDEFQNFATESFANILSEARKYRLCLTLAHQYINQLIFDGNSTVRDAIFGNVGTLVSFRVGAEDAEHLEKEFDPVFLMNDIVNLSKYNIYLKLMIDGITGDAFSATTLPPLDLSETKENEEKVVRVSRERYGKSRKEVEEKIARWSGVLTLEELNNLNGRGSAVLSSSDNSIVKQQSNTRNNNSGNGSLNNQKINQFNNFNNQPAAQSGAQTRSETFFRPAPSISRSARNFSGKAASVQAPGRNFSQSPKPALAKTVPIARPVLKTEEKPVLTSKEPGVEMISKEAVNIPPANNVNLDNDFAADAPATVNPPAMGVNEPKKMFEAVCSTCEEVISVPFNPDPNRPTFCKECLRDYQRAKAMAQREIQAAAQNRANSFSERKPDYSQNNRRGNFSSQDEKREYTPTYLPKDRPMSLDQMSHIAPKKFKSSGKINLSEVRELINKTKEEKNNG